MAVLEALASAGIRQRDVDTVYSSNALAGLLQGQEQIRGQSVLADIGIEGVPVVNVENACASGSTALHQGVLSIRAGAARTVLVLGFEKMVVEELEHTLRALESAADLDVVAGLGLQFSAVYAMRIRRLLELGSITWQDCIDVTVKSRRNGAANPIAQYRQPVTGVEVADSRLIAEPLTRAMCSSVSDGAAALILSSKVADGATPLVRIRASALRSGMTRVSEAQATTISVCAAAAYEEAGLGGREIDVAEVHDAVAPAELMYYEQLGFCAPGEAGQFFRSGATDIRGRLPVNPSGGLTARGHPIGATGVAQVTELVAQLKGQAGVRQVNQPRIGLAQNSGGWFGGEPAAAGVHILERVTPW